MLSPERKATSYCVVLENLVKLKAESKFTLRSEEQLP